MLKGSIPANFPIALVCFATIGWSVDVTYTLALVAHEDTCEEKLFARYSGLTSVAYGAGSIISSVVYANLRSTYKVPAATLFGCFSIAFFVGSVLGGVGLAVSRAQHLASKKKGKELIEKSVVNGDGSSKIEELSETDALLEPREKSPPMLVGRGVEEKVEGNDNSLYNSFYNSFDSFARAVQDAHLSWNRIILVTFLLFSALSAAIGSIVAGNFAEMLKSVDPTQNKPIWAALTFSSLQTGGRVIFTIANSKEVGRYQYHYDYYHHYHSPAITATSYHY